MHEGIQENIKPEFIYLKRLMKNVCLGQLKVLELTLLPKKCKD